MSTDNFHYQSRVQSALRGVARDVLRQISREGLPGDHHLYIVFRTTDEGVMIPPRLRERYPEEMTIVLQNQFSNLKVEDDGFSVQLYFDGKGETLVVPFRAMTGFLDPSVQFGLQFEPPDATDPGVASEPTSSNKAASDGEIIALDQFRKK